MHEKNTPIFSVIIPVYNKGPHINRSINSVLNQTLCDFELVIINDSSTDNSMDELKKFNDQRIHLFHRSTPGPGGYAARNLGIQKATAKWIAFLDADDEWYPNHLQNMYSLIKMFPTVNFFSCGWINKEYEKHDKNRYFISNFQKGNHLISFEDYIKNSLSAGLPVWTSVACLNKCKLPSIEIFPESSFAQQGGDLYTWLLLISFFKKMAWSSHIGAIYHRDSINMVTKTAEISNYLFTKFKFNEMSEHLNTKERKLLAKYYNLKIFIYWKEKLLTGERIFLLYKNFIWRGDFIRCFILSIGDLIPSKMVQKLLSNDNINKIVKSFINRFDFFQR